MNSRVAQIANSEKAQHGRNAMDNLNKLLMYCQDQKYIISFVKSFRVGKSGYNMEQFYAPYKIDFLDKESWILYSTTSMKTDRIKGQQWDALNIKAIDSKISAAYIVYPDSLNESSVSEFESQNQKYVNKLELSAIDGLVSQSCLLRMIEHKALSNRDAGQITDLQGRNFEAEIAMILSSKDNLNKWQTKNPLITGLNYTIYTYIMDKLRLPTKQITCVEATSDKEKIGLLPSGGNPKTDVLMTIYFNDNTTAQFTFSCKRPRPESKSVTVHDYSANTFADVLDKNNVKLRELLNMFQDTPTPTKLKEGFKADLSRSLRPYKNKLTRWVLCGEGGAGNKKQVATHILIYNEMTRTVKLHTVDDYCRELELNGVIGHFGTFFSWTFPSKQRGKRIQLKCKII